MCILHPITRYKKKQLADFYARPLILAFMKYILKIL